MIRFKRGWQRVAPSMLAALVILSGITITTPVFAQQASSTSYSVNEVFFGTGGELNACSTTYCSKQSAGETAVGNTSSTTYQAQAGFNTNREEYLELNVTAANINLGVLVPGTAATATGTFFVKSYLTSGYVVTNGSNPPSIPGYTLTNLTSPTAFNSSNEQFGINLVQNQTTCPTPAPANFGAAPSQVPSAAFSFGAAATGYDTCGLFKYVKGDTIASSTKSSGTTNYTVSYLYNIKNTTPAGTYTFNHIIIATSTF